MSNRVSTVRADVLWSHAVITLHLKSGDLTEGAAARLACGLRVASHARSREFVLLRIAGEDAPPVWEDETEETIAQAMLGSGIGMGCTNARVPENCDLPQVLEDALRWFPGIIFALVTGHLKNTCASLLLRCNIVVSDKDHSLSITTLRCSRELVERGLEVGTTLTAKEAMPLGFASTVVDSLGRLLETEQQMLNTVFDPNTNFNDVVCTNHTLAHARRRESPVVLVGRKSQVASEQMLTPSFFLNRASKDGAPKDVVPKGRCGTQSEVITTFILHHLSPDSTSRSLATLLEDMGFDDKYDFVYVPRSELESPAATAPANSIVYGFVNLRSPYDKDELLALFRGYRFAGALRPCSIAPAKKQGYQSVMRMLQRKRQGRADISELPVFHPSST